MKAVKAVFPLVLVVCLLAGCTKAIDQPNKESKSEPNSAKPSAVNRLALNLDGNSTNGNEKPANKPFKRRVFKDGKGIIGKTTNEIVDLHKAIKENPKLIVLTKNRISGSDPLSQAMSIYTLGSRVQMLAFKHDVDIARNLGDGSPLSFDDIVKRMKTHNIELNMLFQYQTYAYDSKKGDIVILEDPDIKAKVHNK